MRVLVVFFCLLLIFGCSKDKCYDCTQNIKIYTNKMVEGYPKVYKSKFVSCGENTDIVDNPEPLIFNDTVGDTIYTYWKDTDCTKKKLF